ncbi:MAG: cupin domain-containing protein [Ignavibacteria bacterium]
MNTESVIIPEKQNLKELLSYQKGSVVSSVLLKKTTGNITVFAFDEGEGLSEHTTPFDAMVYIIEGKAEITISSKVNIVSEGEMLILPANQPHALKAITKYKMMLVMLK